MSQKKDKQRSSAVPGLAIIGLQLTGVCGVVHSFVSGSGLGLIASAIAFGIIVKLAFNESDF